VTGVVVLFNNRVAGATGTLDLALYNSTAGATVATVSINTSDIPPFVGQNSRPVNFRFSSPVGVTSGQAYQLRMRATSTNTVSQQIIGANQWVRMFTTNSLTGPTATDTMYVLGRFTGAGASSFATVTMDNNNSVQYGGLAIGQNGTLTSLTASSTELRLYDTVAPVYNISLFVSGGVFRMGTSASPIQAGVTASLIIGATTSQGLRIQLHDRASFQTGGFLKTPWSLLVSNIAAGATGFTVSGATGWSVGDDIVISTSTRTNTQYDRRTITSVSGTFIGVTATSFLHTGGTNSIYAAEVINLTRNCKISSANSAFRSYINLAPGINVAGYDLDIDSTELEFMGVASIAAIYGYGYTSSNNIYVRNSAFKDGGGGMTMLTTTRFINCIMDNCVYHNTRFSGQLFLQNGAPVADSILPVNSYVSNNVVTYSGTGAGPGIFTQLPTIDCENNRLSGSATFGIVYGVLSYYQTSAKFNGNVIHGNANGISSAIVNTLDTGLHATGNISVRNSLYGWYMFGTNSMINDSIIQENQSGNLLLSFNSGVSTDFIFNNLSIQGGTATYPTPGGISVSQVGFPTTSFYAKGIFNNCNIGTTNSHTTGDVVFFPTITTNTLTNLVFNNCKFGSPTEVVRPSVMSANAKIGMMRVAGVTAANRTYFRAGLQILDTSIFRSSPYSVRMTPTSSTLYQKFDQKVVPVRQGSTPSISVWVRMSATADGNNYNGTLPRLWLENTASLGVFSGYDDVLLATAATGNGVWKQLSATLPVTPYENTAFKVYLDCSGTVGWVNVDDWRISQ
jgi:hypothetical protein